MISIFTPNLFLKFFELDLFNKEFIFKAISLSVLTILAAIDLVIVMQCTMRDRFRFPVGVTQFFNSCIFFITTYELAVLAQFLKTSCINSLYSVLLKMV